MLVNLPFFPHPRPPLPMNRLFPIMTAALVAALLIGTPVFAREIEDPNKTIFNPPPPKEHGNTCCTERPAVAGPTDCRPRDPDGRPQGLHWNWRGQA